MLLEGAGRLKRRQISASSSSEYESARRKIYDPLQNKRDRKLEWRDLRV
jgi:hypothetical protein